MAKAKENGKPIKQFRCGALSVAVWQREHKDGVFYSVTPSRAYKEKDLEEWSYSDSLNHDDLPVMAQLLNMSFAWITVERAKANETNRD
jgi:hypothetical protein